MKNIKIVLLIFVIIFSFFLISAQTLTWDFTKNQVNYTYDELGRVLSKNNINYSYDGQKNNTLSNITRDNFIVRYEYDDRGRIVKEIREIDGISFVKNLNYDSMDRIVSNNDVDYFYGKDGKVESVDGLVNFTRGEVGNIIFRDYYNSLSTFIDYNNYNFRVESIRTTNESQEWKDDSEYYDISGDGINSKMNFSLLYPKFESEYGINNFTCQIISEDSLDNVSLEFFNGTYWNEMLSYNVTFDDFNDDEIDANKWIQSITYNGGSATLSENSGKLKLYANSDTGSSDYGKSEIYSNISVFNKGNHIFINTAYIAGGYSYANNYVSIILGGTTIFKKEFNPGDASIISYDIDLIEIKKISNNLISIRYRENNNYTPWENYSISDSIINFIAYSRSGGPGSTHGKSYFNVDSITYYNSDNYNFIVNLMTSLDWRCSSCDIYGNCENSSLGKRAQVFSNGSYSQFVEYDYDRTGNVVLINDSINSIKFIMQYDNLNRLINVNIFDVKANFLNYAYDSIGRILGVNSSNGDYEYSNYSGHVYSTLSSVLNIPIDTNKFYIQDSSNNNVAWFGDEGNVVLAGNCTVSLDCQNSINNLFVVQNLNNETVAFVDNEGNLCVESGDCSGREIHCNPEEEGVIFQNSFGQNSTYMTYEGRLCLMGQVYEGITDIN